MQRVPQVSPDTSRSENIEMVSMERSQSRSRIRSLAAQSHGSKKNYGIGIALLLVVVLLWTSSNFLTQDLYVGGYAKPFLVTYLNTASFSLYLVPVFLKRLYRKYRGRTNDDGPIWRGRDARGYEPVSLDPNAAPHSSQHAAHAPNETLQPLTFEETAKLASIFCIFWFIANWSVNASLDYTSVASATILSSMSGFFTLAIGRIFRVEILTISKIAAVFTSFTGVLLVTLSDSSSDTMSTDTIVAAQASKPVLGDFLALLSALFYALYVILLKVRIKDESRINMQLFFGFVGLINIIAGLPIGFLLHVMNIERFELPTNARAVSSLLINMSITLSSDFIYVLAMLKTTPLVVTVGLSLTIPLAVLGDFLLGRPAATIVVLGAVLVLFSFVTVGWEDSKLVEAEAALNGGSGAVAREALHDEEDGRDSEDDGQ